MTVLATKTSDLASNDLARRNCSSSWRTSRRTITFVSIASTAPRLGDYGRVHVFDAYRRGGGFQQDAVRSFLDDEPRACAPAPALPDRLGNNDLSFRRNCRCCWRDLCHLCFLIRVIRVNRENINAVRPLELTCACT